MKPQPPVPEHQQPSKSGYGHPPNTEGRTTPQGGTNAIGPEDEDAGTAREDARRSKPPAPRDPKR
jgi:hypothetical protein